MNGGMVKKEYILPVAVKAQEMVAGSENLLIAKPACVSFRNDGCCEFMQKGAYVVLDFGKELCGSVRLIAGSMDTAAQFRITLGESLTEACSVIGQKNATNDHSPRDFQVVVPGMSDLTFGMSGFRFARMELLTEKPVHIRSAFGVNTLPFFEKEGWIKTDNTEINRIMDTAAYTLKLNLQNGYIWDGIKRDRLVWSGDLHQEILLTSYLYGGVENIRNCLTFLKEETLPTQWINGIPTYSAWWIINLCDYCRLSGDRAYFAENREYAQTVIENISRCIQDNGEMDFSVAPYFMPYFLDWPTLNTPDAKIGTAALLVYMAKKYLEIEENKACSRIATVLAAYLDMDCEFKQTRAFQILAGRDPAGQAEFLEKDGAVGFSTFMAYYILKADAMAGGKKMLSLITEYFGGMLSRGATTFWEDFDIAWLEGSGRIDAFPEEGQKDIHGDFGAFCYEGFRHSLCHGWSSGVLAFMIEHIMGLTLDWDGTYHVKPHAGDLKTIEARLPLRDGWLKVHVVGNTATAETE
jgi:hypothetical protein